MTFSNEKMIIVVIMQNAKGTIYATGNDYWLKSKAM